MRSPFTLMALATTASVLTACGGGGGDGSSTTATSNPVSSTSSATFPVQSAYNKFITTPQNFNLSTTYQGKTI